jgi:hypothetical protein
MIPLPALFTYKFKKDWRIDKKKPDAKKNIKTLLFLLKHRGSF